MILAAPRRALPERGADHRRRRCRPRIRASGRWSSRRPPIRPMPNGRTRNRNSSPCSSCGTPSTNSCAAPDEQQAAAPGAAPTSSPTCACASGATSMASCMPCAPSTAGRRTSKPATYDAIHQALLAGLLGNLGLQGGGEPALPRRARHPVPDPSGLGAGARRPGSGSWRRRSPRPRASSDAASRASNRSGWRQVGAHLVKRHVYEPHWEKKAGQVVGLGAGHAPRRAASSGTGACTTARFDPELCRDIFIRQALVTAR